MTKYLKFLFPIIYTAPVILKLSGFDNKGILLMLTSPPAWITELRLFQLNFKIPIEIRLSLIIIITYFFWYGFGLFIEKFLQKIYLKYLFLFLYSIMSIIELILNQNKMIFLALTSPPFWFNWNNFTKSHPDGISIFIIISITLLFWYGFGVLLEKVFNKINELKIGKEKL